MRPLDKCGNMRITKKQKAATGKATEIFIWVFIIFISIVFIVGVVSTESDEKHCQGYEWSTYENGYQVCNKVVDGQLEQLWIKHKYIYERIPWYKNESEI